jgi:hypothetical protein
MPVEKLLLYAALSLSAGFHLLVLAKVIDHWSPLEKLRAKRARKAALAATLTQLRERLPEFRTRACRQVRPSPFATISVNIGRHARELTEDLGDMPKVIEEAMRQGLLEAAESVAADAASTLDLVDRLLKLRENVVPAKEAEFIAIARRAVADVRSLRDTVIGSVDYSGRFEDDEAVAFAGEQDRLKRLDNAFDAFELLATTDPDAVIKATYKQRQTIRDVVIMARLREQAIVSISADLETASKLIGMVSGRCSAVISQAVGVAAPYAAPAERFLERATDAMRNIALARAIALKPLYGPYIAERAKRRFKRAMGLAGRGATTLVILDFETELLGLLQHGDAKRHGDNPEGEPAKH